MKNLPLNSLRAFAVIYETGGVRAAARKLGIAHSSISRHLSELEGWLETSLTLKGTGSGGLRFTSHGRALGEATLAHLQELAQTVASIREARSAMTVHIGTHPSLAVRWLLPRLPHLEKAHPNIEVSVIVDRVFSDLEADDLDVAIRMGEERSLKANWQPLMGDVLYPVMSRSLWEQSGRPSRPRDLAKLRLLHDRDPQASWAAWKNAHGPTNLDVRKGSRLTSTDLVLRAAANSQGVALARHQLAASDISSGVLLRPFGELEVILEYSYWLVVPRRSFPTPAAKVVIEWLEREAEHQVYGQNPIFDA